MRDEDVIKHIEATIRDIHEESPPLKAKGVLGVVVLIASAVVAIGGAATYTLNAWTSLGWVTRAQYTSDAAAYERRDEYLRDSLVNAARNDRQDADIKAQSETANEILAYVKIVPQLKTLIKIRCMGNPDVQSTIDGLKYQYKQLTKEDYKEPRCDDPEIKVIR